MVARIQTSQAEAAYDSLFAASGKELGAIAHSQAKVAQDSAKKENQSHLGRIQIRGEERVSGMELAPGSDGHTFQKVAKSSSKLFVQIALRGWDQIWRDFPGQRSEAPEFSGVGSERLKLRTQSSDCIDEFCLFYTIGGWAKLAYYSTVTGNKAHAGQNAKSEGGGIATGYGAITASTIDSNSADFAAGVDLFGNKQMTITNSTISANTSTAGAGGIGMYFQAQLKLVNSTIAFNRSSSGAGGLSVAVSNSLVMHSTIIAENAGSASAADLHVVNSSNVSGAHNLVMHADAFLPSGVVTFTANPKLAPLGNHGGTTLTNALSKGSPAIDQGDNTAGLFDDQRGLGYSRTVGFGFVPDIGAYERQDNDDEIYADGFGF